ncbi:MAG TPA: bifunctional 3-(3-hydroxy-phenyl)propionate/3-hydroxycinnamic acid hydroxylase [Burkholderiales bacterium]|nr:bifunctional 3-(3-hydroxy-phenyl)propionate/3-hydroxycinnamic acid hydroxylase [Burkholderiales bacterium]
MNDSFDVAVVGLGPAGAACAALLGTRGVKTVAIERSREVYDKPRAFALDHEIMRVFEDLGIAEAVAPHTAPFTPSEYYGAEGQLIKRLDALPPPWPLGWPPSMVFEQPAVERLLRKRAAEVAEVRFDEVVGLGVRDESVDLHLQNGKSLSARYVVGCDGAASTVRKLLGIDYVDLEFDQEWLVVDLRVNERGLAKLPQVSIQYCEPARPSTYLIGVGSHRRWELMLQPGEQPDPWKLLARWLTPDDAELWRAAAYRFHALVARHWRGGRVFLAGDAAHQQPPFTGQGMCQGIRDVANLSWKLQYVLAGKAGDRLLDTYELERSAHVKRLTATIKEIGTIIGERDPKAARARDRRLLKEAGGKVVTVPRQNLIPPLEGGFRSPHPHSANGTLFPKDGKGGMRVVVRTPENPPYLQAWFERHHALAAIVRPDHYVYGIANSNPALDRTLAGMAEQLK